MSNIVNSVILDKRKSTKVDKKPELNVQGNKYKSYHKRDMKSKNINTGYNLQGNIKYSTFQCDRCTFSTTSKKFLQIHTSNVHKQVLYGCSKCTFCVHSKYELLNHTRLHHLEKDPLVKKKVPEPHQR